ncbi:MAG: NAD-binding protein [Fusobacterium sp.]
MSIYSKEKCSKKEETFQKLSEIFSGFTIEADEIEKYTLLLANIERAEIIITATNDDNTNLMITQIAKKICNVPKVIARVFDPTRQKLYEDFGIETISPISLSIEKFKSLV